MDRAETRKDATGATPEGARRARRNVRPLEIIVGISVGRLPRAAEKLLSRRARRAARRLRADVQAAGDAVCLLGPGGDYVRPWPAGTVHEEVGS